MNYFKTKQKKYKKNKNKTQKFYSSARIIIIHQ